MGISQFLYEKYVDTETEISPHLLQGLLSLEQGNFPNFPLSSLTSTTDLSKQVREYISLVVSYWKGELIPPEIPVSFETVLDHAMTIITTRILVRKGEYRTGQELLNQVLDTEMDPYLRAAYQAEFALIHHELGFFAKSQDYYNNALNQLILPMDPLRSYALIGLADVLTHTGNYTKAEALLHEALSNLQEIHHKPYLAYCHHIFGLLHYFSGNHEDAQSQFSQALDYYQDLGNTGNVARVYYSLAEFHYSLGDYQQARKYLDLTRPPFEDLNNKRDTSFIYMLQALMLGAENLHDDAIHSINQSISLLQEVGDKPDLSSAYQIKGEILYKQGVYEEASTFIQKSLKIKQSFGNPTLIATALFFLILIHQRKGDVDQAEIYFEELTKVYENQDIAYLECFYLAAKGFLLKHKSRLRYKVEALEIFQELQQREDLEYELKIFSLLNLLELQLLELKLFEKNEMIEDILMVINQIMELAEYNYHHSLKVEVSLLKSRLYLIRGDINAAYELLSSLNNVVEEVNNEFLQHRVKQEQEHFEEELEMWKNTLDQGSSMADKLQTAQIQDYLRDISKRFEFEKG